jgi:hypothetical protein
MRNYLKFTVYLLLSASLITACNKEKKLMEGLIGNWNIDESEKAYLNYDGTEEVYERIFDAGKLIISEDQQNPSKTSKHYKLTFIDGYDDTLKAEDMLITDEKNKRIILQNAITDSTGLQRNMVWTIKKEKKNKQVWTLYGTDSTFFYPVENNNPGATSTSMVWRLTLDRK